MTLCCGKKLERASSKQPGTNLIRTRGVKPDLFATRGKCPQTGRRRDQQGCSLPGEQSQSTAPGKEKEQKRKNQTVVKAGKIDPGGTPPIPRAGSNRRHGIPHRGKSPSRRRKKIKNNTRGCWETGWKQEVALKKKIGGST